MGWALEAMYQAPVQDLITQRVLHPMHLAQATFAPDAANSVPTTYSERLGLRAGLVHDPKSATLGEHSGAAGLFASLDDLITFAQVMLGQRTTSAFHTPWPEELMHDYTKINSVARWGGICAPAVGACGSITQVTREHSCCYHHNYKKP
nr:serine hydrolase [Lacticaseibacillus saniviri]